MNLFLYVLMAIFIIFLIFALGIACYSIIKIIKMWEDTK